MSNNARIGDNYLSRQDFYNAIDERNNEIEGLKEELTELVGSEREETEETIDELWNEIKDIEEALCRVHSGTLIHENDFENYAVQLVEDLHGDTSVWPFSCLNWAAAATVLKQDYVEVELLGNTYLTLS